MRPRVLTHTALWNILLCAVFCSLAIPPFGSAQSIADLKTKAEGGDVQAQLALAKAYHLGEGTEKDEAQAVRWWQKAAEHGDIVAEGSLASAYFLGAGVPKNDAAAVRWWQKAAEQGDATAEGNLGTAYGLGRGVPKDPAESLRWHTKAAEHGNAASQFSLGMFYIGGAGVPKDEAEGVKWLRKSADQGNADGEFWLGAAYSSGTGVAKDTAEALRWYRKAGDHGSAAAQYNLGQAYNLGNGVEKDPTEAVRWWQKAAEQGMAKAQYNLGLAYHDGIGVQKDDVQAYFWIALAAKSLEQGFVKDHRDKAEALLTAAQLADVQQRVRKWEGAHPATQIASLNSLPSVPQDQHQAQPQAQLVALGIRPVLIALTKAATCDGKLASVLLSSFKEAISTSQRHELIRDLSDNGKMDTVLIIQMACEERNNSVSVTSTYGEARCFGPKNCHIALDPRTGNVLSCDPNGEPICGKELFKEFEYVLATTGIHVKLE